MSESLHFGRSATALGMSTSALTRAIQRLEEELGHPLLIRDRRRVSLTAAGQRFRAFAQAQLSEWEVLREELDAQRQSPRGDLRIACTVTACYSVLPTLLGRCRRRFPDIVVRLATGDASRSMRDLDHGDVDVAVVPTDDIEDDPHTIPLAHASWVLIGPRSPSDLDPVLEHPDPDWGRIPFVAPMGGIDRSRIERWFEERRIRPPIHAEVAGNEAIIAMVGLGGGIAWVPDLVLAGSPLRDRVHRLEERDAPRGYAVSLCTTPRGLRRRVVQVFWTLAGSQVARPTP